MTCWTTHSDPSLKSSSLSRPAAEALHAEHLGSIPGDPTTPCAVPLSQRVTGSTPLEGTSPYKRNLGGFYTRAREQIFRQRVQPSRAYTHSGIAHSVERQIRDLKVAGSNPASKTLALRPLGHADTFSRARRNPRRTSHVHPFPRPAGEALHATRDAGSNPVRRFYAAVAEWTGARFFQPTFAASPLGRETFPRSIAAQRGLDERYPGGLS